MRLHVRCAIENCGFFGDANLLVDSLVFLEFMIPVVQEEYECFNITLVKIA